MNPFLTKNLFKLILTLTLLFTALSLSGCFSMYGADEGVITINLGGGVFAAAANTGQGGATPMASVSGWPTQETPGLLPMLDFVIKLESDDGRAIRFDRKGAGTVRIAVPLGVWNISVEAFYDEYEFAYGSKGEVEITAGQRKQVSIEMEKSDYEFLMVGSTNVWQELSSYGYVTGAEYIVVVTQSFTTTASASTGTFGTATEVVLIGDHKITLDTSSRGSLLKILPGQTVTMINTDIEGHLQNTANLVTVENATFNMKGSASISGNKIESGMNEYAGGILVFSNGIFNMYDGTINNNQGLKNGGGVSLGSGGTAGVFNMYGGTIYENQAVNGGGVYLLSVAGTEFNMEGGTISKNKGSNGGGVSVSGGTFYMKGGIISGNTASLGGGVSVNAASSLFEMSGTAVINGNSVSGEGGNGLGGGVYVTYGTFTMNGGEISGNSANNTSGLHGGGGVHVYSDGTFNMNKGTIYGDPASPQTLANTALTGRGASLYKISSGTVNGAAIPTLIADGTSGHTNETITAP